MINRENFLFHRDAALMITVLVPQFATATSIKKDAGDYWLNVHWNCGIVAPLTTNETEQALGE